MAFRDDRPGGAPSARCLGLGGSNHDFAAAITSGGEVVVAVEEERLARRKYAIGVNSLFTRARGYCLDSARLSMEDIDAVVADDTLMPGVYFTLRRRIELIRHHAAHLASAFYPSPFTRAAVLVVDGAGSFFEDSGVETLTYGIGEGASVSEIGKVFGTNWETDRLSSRRIYQIGECDHSLGYMYKIVSRAIGFVSFADETWFHTDDGKTMGLAPYGTNRLQQDFREFLELLPDGQFALHIKDDGLAAYVDRVAAQRRDADAFLVNADLAWAAQALLEEVLLHAGRHLAAHTGCRDLCMSGGVALNSVANGKLLAAGDFDRVYVQPAAGDAGNAIGCALHGYHGLLEGPRPREPDSRSGALRHAYLGRSYPAAHVERAISESRLPFARLDDVCAATARLLAEGLLIGWFQGASEFGPRALGNRSILADPRDAAMKDTLNSRVKHREAFRPFAPAVLQEHMDEYFELGIPSPFMLLVAPVRPEKHDVIPAVVHVDGTARVQSLTRVDNGMFYDLVAAFGELTSVPVVLNTSLNDHGQPIVELPEEALAFFGGGGLDLLVIEGFVVARQEDELAAALALVACPEAHTEPGDDGSSSDAAPPAREAPTPLATNDCYSATYGYLLQCLGHDPRVLGGDWGFTYDHDEAAEWPLGRLRIMTRSYAEWIRAWYGFEQRERQHPSFDDAWRHLRMTTAAGRQVIVFVDTYELREAGPYPKAHVPHRIVVFDCRGDQAYVVDAARRYLHRGWIDSAVLGAAMQSPELATGLLYPAQNVTVELVAGDGPQAPASENVLAALRTFGATGTDGLRTLAADMERDAPLEADGKLSASRLAEGIMLFNELASQRGINSEFLELAAELTGLERLLDSRELAQQLAETWDALRLVFWYVGVKKPATVLRHLAPRMREIAALEDEFASGIASVVAASASPLT